MSDYIDVQGCLTFWVSGDGVSRALLREVIAAEGVKHSTPRARQPMSALKRAAHEAIDAEAWPLEDRRGNVLVRPIPKRWGYAVVRERADGTGLKHEHLGSVLLVKDPSGGVWVDAEARYASVPDAFLDAVQAGFTKYLDRLSRSSLSDFLTSLLAHEFGATSLRPSGGLYQFRESRYEAWLAWVTKVNSCVVPGRSGPVVYTLKHAMDEQAARAVLDGLRREILARAAELKEEVTGSRIGSRGKKTRKQEAYRLMARVEEVEGLLNEHLPDLKAALAEVTALTGGLEVLAAIEENAA